MIQTVFLIILVHVVYYTIFQVLDDFNRIGSKVEIKHKEILRLQTEYNVNVRVFHSNDNKRLGFAWFNTIYLNENLLRGKQYKALNWVFFHEYYHVIHNHKLKILLGRLAFSFTPALLFVNWWVFAVVYVCFALYLYWLNEDFEKKADENANQKLGISEEVNYNQK